MIGETGPSVQGKSAADRRAALLGRWLDLTRTVLPAMASVHGWPIHEDHCFMRVCLDAAIGAPWPTAIRRPAIRSMSEAELAAAVRVAQMVVEHPEMLTSLNRDSLQWRRAAKREAPR